MNDINQAKLNMRVWYSFAYYMERLFGRYIMSNDDPDFIPSTTDWHRKYKL